MAVVDFTLSILVEADPAPGAPCEVGPTTVSQRECLFDQDSHDQLGELQLNPCSALSTTTGDWRLLSRHLPAPPS